MTTADQFCWNDIREDLQSSSKQRLTGLDSLSALLQRTTLGKLELGELLDISPSLLADANSKVALQALEALDVVIQRSGDSLTPYAGLLVPAVVERLGDTRQPVRQQALRVLLSLFEVQKPELVVDRFAHLWQHKNWKVKHGLLEVLAEVVSKAGAASVLGGTRDQSPPLVKQIVKMMDDPDMTVREAAVGCLTEVYRQMPVAVVSSVQGSNLRPTQQRDLFARLGMSTSTTEHGPSDAGSNRGSNSGTIADTSFQYVMDAPSHSGGRVSSAGGVVPLVSDSIADTSKADTRRQGPSNSSAPAAAKRGGFKDGGGVTTDGELAPAVPIHIASERELRAELETATATLALAPDAEWQARMSAMQRVEGLVLGGAADYECFYDAMKGLAQALSQQFKERRSIIARQACHLIGFLSRALGPRFEPHALAVLPTLFGVLVITVQVMAESADMGVREVLRHCQTGRVMQIIIDGICKEKNPKARQWCVGYLKLILEDWDVGVWGRQLDAMEPAIRHAAQDSSSETRQLARSAMALYHSALPDRAQAFLKKLDGGLQERLSAGLTASRPAKPASAISTRQSISAAIAAKKLARQAAAAQQEGDDAGVLIMVPGSKPERRSEPQQPRGASRPSSAVAAPSNSAVGASASEPAYGPSSDAARSQGAVVGARNSRKSMGLPPGRIPGGSTDLTGLVGDGSVPSASTDAGGQARAAAVRRPRMSAVPQEPQRVPAPMAQPSTPAMRFPVDAAPARVPYTEMPEAPTSRPSMPAVPVPSTSARTAGAWQDRGGAGELVTSSGAGLVPLSRVVTTIAGGPRTWSEKVDALSALGAHVRASAPGGAATVSGESLALVNEPEKMAQALERVRERIFEALEDPHLKVLAAALTLLIDLVRHYARVLEAQLDRLLPLLFNKGAEQKEQMRALCADALAECGRAYRPDVLVPVLSKCLELVKVPRGKQAVLEFFKAHVLGASGGTQINSTQFKHWLVRLAPLLDDRSIEMRRRATDVMDALMAAPWAREPINYVAYQHNSPDVAPLRRYLLSAQSSSPPHGAGGITGAGGLQPPTHMTVAGVAPAASSGTRPPLPSATLTMPVVGSVARGAPAPAPAGSGAYGQLRSAAAAPAPAAAAPHETIPTTSYRPSAGGTAAEPSGPSTTVSSPSLSRPVPESASTSRQGESPGAASCEPSAGRAHENVPSGAQPAVLSQLLERARAAVNGGSDLPQQAQALEALAEAVEHCGPEAWGRTFPMLMVEVGAWAGHPAKAVRAMTYALLKELISHQRHLFTDTNLEANVGRLLQGVGDPSREVCMTAGQALRLLLSHCTEHKAMLLLQRLLPRERDAHRREQDRGERLVAVMEGVRLLAARLGRSELHYLTFSPHPEAGTTLLEALVASLADTETPVRRGAVVTLADLWYRLGHSVRDVLQVLAGGSFHLLCVYYLKLHGVAVPPHGPSPMEHPLVQGPPPEGQ